MRNLCLVALHFNALWTFRAFVSAQSQTTPWATVLANDPSVTWTPELCHSLVGHCQGWFELDILGHKYVVAQAPSPSNSLSYTFRASAIEVYGGAIDKAGSGVVTLDGQRQPDSTFKTGLESQRVASFSDLDISVQHTLIFTFSDSPPTKLGFDYFLVQRMGNASTTSQGLPTSAIPTPSSTGIHNAPTGSTESPGRLPRLKKIVSLPSPGSSPPVDGIHAQSGTQSLAIVSAGPATVTYYSSFDSPGSASSTASDRSGPRPWEIAVLVLGILALLLSAAVGFFLWRRRRTRTRVGATEDEKCPPVAPPSGTHTPENAGPTPPANTEYVFTRPGSSVSTARPTPWRNSRIGVSPYTYERAVPYPESTTERSSWIDPIPIPMPARRSIHAVLEVVPARHISFSGKGRILKVQNPETRSTTSVTETDTAH